VPTPKFVATYKLMVFEVLPHQNPVQAMRSNFPILTQEVRGTTQYIWQPQGIINDINLITDSANNRGYNNNTVRTDRPNNPKKKTAAKMHMEVKKVSDVTNANGVDYGQKNKVEHSGDPHEYKKFVWTIQALDNLGNPMGDGNVNGDGVSEPIIFKVAKGGKEVDKLKEEIKK
jgi:hypothetical protein